MLEGSSPFPTVSPHPSYQAELSIVWTDTLLLILPSDFSFWQEVPKNKFAIIHCSIAKPSSSSISAEANILYYHQIVSPNFLPSSVTIHQDPNTAAFSLSISEQWCPDKVVRTLVVLPGICISTNTCTDYFYLPMLEQMERNLFYNTTGSNPSLP